MLFKNGGVKWRAVFLSLFLHSLYLLLLAISASSSLPPPLPQGASLYMQVYGANHVESNYSPAYRAFVQYNKDELVPFLQQQQGLLGGGESGGGAEGEGEGLELAEDAKWIILPLHMQLIWIAACNLLSFMVLKLISFAILQRQNAASNKKKKAD